MKKLIKIFLICLVVGAPLMLGAQNIEYAPLEPLPGLEDAQKGTGNFGELVQGFFRILVNVAAFVAVTMLVIGGITYMFSEATVTKFVAKEKIRAAFFGMAILAGAWLILNTVNPQLLMFNKNLLSPTESLPESAPGSLTNVSGGGILQTLQPTQWTFTQGIAASSAVGCSFFNVTCFNRLEYITFAPQFEDTPAVQEAIENYHSLCESLWSGSWTGRVERIDGGIFGAPGQTALVCPTLWSGS